MMIMNTILFIIPCIIIVSWIFLLSILICKLVFGGYFRLLDYLLNKLATILVIINDSSLFNSPNDYIVEDTRGV